MDESVLPSAFETSYRISYHVHEQGTAGPQGSYSGTPVITLQPMAKHDHVTQVPDNMRLAIVALFSCWPLALLAIRKALESKSAMARNDIPTAIATANDAKR